MATLFDYKNQAWTVDGVYVDCGHPPVGTVMGAGSPAPGEVFQGCKCYGKAHVGESVPSEGNDKMRLETTITDQILLTFGDGPNRSVLKVWHISERDAAELYLANLRKGE